MLLVAPNEMKTRLEVGSAVKSLVSDKAAREIVENSILPSFERGDMDKGVLSASTTANSRW